MKSLKALCLLPVVLVIGLLLAEPASATTMCATNTTPCNAPYVSGTELHLTLKSGSSEAIKTTGGTTLVTCTGDTMKAQTQNSTASRIWTWIRSWFHSGCTNTVSTITLGEMSIENIKGTSNGLVRLAGSEITVNGIFGESCIYGAGAESNIGTLVGGVPATLSVSTILKKTGGGGLCPAEARWEAAWVVTSPNPLYIEP